MHEASRTGWDRKSWRPEPPCESLTPPLVGGSPVSATGVSCDSSWMSTVVASGPGCWRAAYAGVPGCARPTESCWGSGDVSDHSLPLPESQTTQCVPTAVTWADFDV